MNTMDSNLLHHTIKFAIKTNDLDKLKKKPDKSFVKVDIPVTEVNELLNKEKVSKLEGSDVCNLNIDDTLKGRPLICDNVVADKIKKPAKRCHQIELEEIAIKNRKIEDKDQVIIEPETSSALVIRGLPRSTAPVTITKEQSILQIFSARKDVIIDKLEEKFNLIDRLCQTASADNSLSSAPKKTNSKLEKVADIKKHEIQPEKTTDSRYGKSMKSNRNEKEYMKQPHADSRSDYAKEKSRKHKEEHSESKRPSHRDRDHRSPRKCSPDQKHKSRHRSKSRSRHRSRDKDCTHKSEKNRHPTRSLQMGPLSLREEFMVDTERIVVSAEEQLEQSFHCQTTIGLKKDKHAIAERLQKLLNKTKETEEKISTEKEINKKDNEKCGTEKRQTDEKKENLKNVTERKKTVEKETTKPEIVQKEMENKHSVKRGMEGTEGREKVTEKNSEGKEISKREMEKKYTRKNESERKDTQRKDEGKAIFKRGMEKERERNDNEDGETLKRVTEKKKSHEKYSESKGTSKREMEKKYTVEKEKERKETLRKDEERRETLKKATEKKNSNEKYSEDKGTFKREMELKVTVEKDKERKETRRKDEKDVETLKKITEKKKSIEKYSENKETVNKRSVSDTCDMQILVKTAQMKDGKETKDRFVKVSEKMESKKTVAGESEIKRKITQIKEIAEKVIKEKKIKDKETAEEIKSQPISVATPKLSRFSVGRVIPNETQEDISQSVFIDSFQTSLSEELPPKATSDDIRGKVSFVMPLLQLGKKKPIVLDTEKLFGGQKGFAKLVDDSVTQKSPSKISFLNENKNQLSKSSRISKNSSLQEASPHTRVLALDTDRDITSGVALMVGGDGEMSLDNDSRKKLGKPNSDVEKQKMSLGDNENVFIVSKSAILKNLEIVTPSPSILPKKNSLTVKQTQKDDQQFQNPQPTEISASNLSQTDFSLVKQMQKGDQQFQNPQLSTISPSNLPQTDSSVVKQTQKGDQQFQNPQLTTISPSNLPQTDFSLVKQMQKGDQQFQNPQLSPISPSNLLQTDSSSVKQMQKGDEQFQNPQLSTISPSNLPQTDFSVVKQTQKGDQQFQNPQLSTISPSNLPQTDSSVVKQTQKGDQQFQNPQLSTISPSNLPQTDSSAVKQTQKGDQQFQNPQLTTISPSNLPQTDSSVVKQTQKGDQQFQNPQLTTISPSNLPQTDSSAVKQTQKGDQQFQNPQLTTISPSNLPQTDSSVVKQTQKGDQQFQNPQLTTISPSNLPQTDSSVVKQTQKGDQQFQNPQLSTISPSNLPQTDFSLVKQMQKGDEQFHNPQLSPISPSNLPQTDSSTVKQMQKGDQQLQNPQLSPMSPSNLPQTDSSTVKQMQKGDQQFQNPQLSPMSPSNLPQTDSSTVKQMQKGDQQFQNPQLTTISPSNLPQTDFSLVKQMQKGDQQFQNPQLSPISSSKFPVNENSEIGQKTSFSEEKNTPSSQSSMITLPASSALREKVSFQISPRKVTQIPLISLASSDSKTNIRPAESTKKMLVSYVDLRNSAITGDSQTMQIAKTIIMEPLINKCSISFRIKTGAAEQSSSVLANIINQKIAQPTEIHGAKMKPGAVEIVEFEIPFVIDDKSARQGDASITLATVLDNYLDNSKTQFAVGTNLNGAQNNENEREIEKCYEKINKLEEEKKPIGTENDQRSSKGTSELVKGEKITKNRKNHSSEERKFSKNIHGTIDSVKCSKEKVSKNVRDSTESSKSLMYHSSSKIEETNTKSSKKDDKSVKEFKKEKSREKDSESKKVLKNVKEKDNSVTESLKGTDKCQNTKAPTRKETTDLKNDSRTSSARDMSKDYFKYSANDKDTREKSSKVPEKIKKEDEAKCLSKHSKYADKRTYSSQKISVDRHRSRKSSSKDSPSPVRQRKGIREDSSSRRRYTRSREQRKSRNWSRRSRSKGTKPARLSAGRTKQYRKYSSSSMSSSTDNVSARQKYQRNKKRSISKQRDRYAGDRHRSKPTKQTGRSRSRNTWKNRKASKSRSHSRKKAKKERKSSSSTTSDSSQSRSKFNRHKHDSKSKIKDRKKSQEKFSDRRHARSKDSDIHRQPKDKSKSRDRAPHSKSQDKIKPKSRSTSGTHCSLQTEKKSDDKTAESNLEDKSSGHDKTSDTKTTQFQLKDEQVAKNDTLIIPETTVMVLEMKCEPKIEVKERSLAEKCVMNFLNRSIRNVPETKAASIPMFSNLRPQVNIVNQNAATPIIPAPNINYFVTTQPYIHNPQPPIYSHNYPQQRIYPPHPYSNSYPHQPHELLYPAMPYKNYTQNCHINGITPNTYLTEPPPPPPQEPTPVVPTATLSDLDILTYQTTPPPPPPSPSPPSITTDYQPDLTPDLLPDDTCSCTKHSSTSSLTIAVLDMDIASPSLKSIDSNVPLKLDDNLSDNDDLSSCGDFEFEDIEPLDPFQKYADAPRPKYEHIIKTEVHISVIGKRFEYAYLKSTSCNCVPPNPDEIRIGKTACDENCFNRQIKVECNNSCPVYELCTNRRFQEQIYAPIEPFYCGADKGWGIRSLGKIAAGMFVIEYVGELIDNEEFINRINHNDSCEHHYFMAIQKDMYLDAGSRGNWSRFVNHSCEPNMMIEKWVVNGKTRIGFFSTKEIGKDEEITIDYQFQQFGSVEQKCYCASVNCTGIMGKVNEKLQEQIKMSEIRRRIDLIQRIITRKSLKEISHVSEMITVIKEQSLERNTFVNFLDVLLRTGSHLCTRTFVECGGLNVITSYLDTVVWNDWPLKMLYLQCLDHFKLKKRTLLNSGSTSAKVVDYWSCNPRYELTHVVDNSTGVDLLNDDSETVDSFLDPIPVNNASPIEFVLRSIDEPISDAEKQAQDLALKIKEYFSQEMEKFFIPKMKNNAIEFTNELSTNDSESKSISIASSIQGDFVQQKTRKLKNKCTEVIQKLPKEEFRRLFSERYHKSVAEKNQLLLATEPPDNDKYTDAFPRIKQRNIFLMGYINKKLLQLNNPKLHVAELRSLTAYYKHVSCKKIKTKRPSILCLMCVISQRIFSQITSVKTVNDLLHSCEYRLFRLGHVFSNLWLDLCCNLWQGMKRIKSSINGFKDDKDALMTTVRKNEHI